MSSLNNDIGNICNQFKISKEDEIKFNKLRDEIATLGQQVITLNETRFNAINKMQELLDKYTIDANIVNNFISNVEKYPSTTIINDKHTSKTAPKTVSDETVETTEPKPTKMVKKKPQAPKKSGAAATTIEDEEEPETKDEPETQEKPEPETSETQETEPSETKDEPETQEPETSETQEPETSETQETETSETKNEPEPE